MVFTKYILHRMRLSTDPKNYVYECTFPSHHPGFECMASVKLYSAGNVGEQKVKKGRENDFFSV